MPQGKSENVDVAQVLKHKFQDCTVSYNERDVIIYALGVGAGQKNPTDTNELRFTYEGHSQFAALPTIGVIFPFGVLNQVAGGVEGLTFNPMMILHGEQYLEIKGPIPTAGTLVSTAKVGGIFDKGRGAVLQLDTVTVDSATGKEIFTNQFSLFIRGIGGFGGDRGPADVPVAVPNRAPDVVEKDKTSKQQALLYRQSGDANPLHADPDMAAVGNFDQPILHGLCTFGHAGRAVLRHFAESDPTRFKSIRVRFSKHVFPGETIVTEMWKISPTKILFQCRVEEREGLVLTNAVVELHGASPKL